jgi:tetratricopeptide (TPR) repeat protein
METIREALEAAVGHHHAGRLDEAGRIYAQVIAADPDNAVAWHLSGVAASQKGDTAAAIECFQKAVKLQPNYSDAHNNLGVALERVGRLDDAVACYRRALSVRPDFQVALINLGNTLLRQGKHDGLAACDHQALALRPGFAKELDNRGADLQRQGRFDDAIACHRRALQLNPNDFETHDNLGVALQELGRFDEAAVCHREAIRLSPNVAQPHFNLGVALEQLGQIELAAASCRRAAELDPAHFEAATKLGVVLEKQRRFGEAERWYRRSVELRPDYYESVFKVAVMCEHQAKADAAERWYGRALELRPDDAEAHWNLSNVYLLKGDFERGWYEQKWRWQLGKLAPRDFDQPPWTGQSLEDKTLLVHVEQGLGDTIQFVRYAPLLKALRANVIWECQRPLARLLARCKGIDRLIPVGDALPSFDYRSPLMSIPGVLKTTVETIPAEVPYVFADPNLVSQWQEKLSGIDALRIGINWHGREGEGPYRHRDIPLEFFARLARLEGVRLLSLQKGAERDDVKPPIIHPGDIDAAHGSFMDTAAIMMNLDLVITSDTSIAHVAGALGVPVWVALPFAGDWRWMLNRSDSPWYPTMRLFRQTTAGEWSSVFVQIREAVEAMLTS